MTKITEKILRIIIGCAVVVGVFAQEDPCVPTCVGKLPGEKVADPFDCSRYFICGPDEQISESSYLCSPPGYFDATAKECSDTAPCIQICGACTLTCNKADPLIIAVADPLDCAVFYECGIVAGPPQTCPGHVPYYDSSTYTCTDVESVCCKPGCTPICAVPDTISPDPADCTKYYYCMAAPPHASFSCPAGENYDIQNGACSPTASCTTWCQANVFQSVLPGNPLELGVELGA